MNLAIYFVLIISTVSTLISCGGGSTKTHGDFCEASTNPLLLEENLNVYKTMTIYKMDETFVHHDGKFKFDGLDFYYNNHVDPNDPDNPEKTIRIFAGFRKNKDGKFMPTIHCVGGPRSTSLKRYLPISFNLDVVTDYVVSANGEKINIETRNIRVDFKVRPVVEKKGWLLLEIDEESANLGESSLKKPYKDHKDLELPENKMNFFRLKRADCDTPFQTRAHLNLSKENKSPKADNAIALRVSAHYIGPDRFTQEEKEHKDFKDLDCEEQELDLY